MRTALICTDPPEPFITLDQAKKHLRVESPDDDDLIEALAAAACLAIDGGDGNLKRAVSEQTWKLVLPSLLPHHHHMHRARLLAGHPFRHHQAIDIPLPPTVSVSSITYFDNTDTEITLDAGQYRLIDCGTEPAYVIPTASWPSCARRPDAATITFAAGYPAGEIPPGIIAAAKLILGDLYANREATYYTSAQALENPAVCALLFPHRILA